MKRILIIILILTLVCPSLLFAAAPRAVDDLKIRPGIEGFGTGTLAAFGNVDPPVIAIITAYPTDTAGEKALAESTRNGNYVLTGGYEEIGEASDAQIISALSSDPPTTGQFGLLILFDIGGNFDFGCGTVNIQRRYVSVIGASAPFPGVHFQNLNHILGNSDIYINHLNLGQGEDGCSWGDTCDWQRPLTIDSDANEVNRVVVDHCSGYYGNDTNFSIWNENYTTDTKNITSWYSAWVAPLHHNTCHSSSTAEVDHGFTATAGGEGTERISIIGNLFADGYTRNPRSRGESAIFINNLSFNSEEAPKLNDDAENVAASKFSYRGNVNIWDDDTSALAKYGVKLQSLIDGDNDLYIDDILTWYCSEDNNYLASCATETSSSGTAAAIYLDGTSWTIATDNFEHADVDTSNLTVLASETLVDSTHANYLLPKVGAYSAWRDSITGDPVRTVVGYLEEVLAKTDLGAGVYLDAGQEVWPAVTETARTVGAGTSFNEGIYALPSSSTIFTGGSSTEYTVLEIYTQHFIGEGKWSVEFTAESETTSNIQLNAQFNFQ